MPAATDWPNQAVQYLSDNYHTTSYNAMALALGLHPMAVLRQCKRLGLVRPAAYLQRWTPDMDDYLRQNWFVKSADEIAAYLQRTKGSVNTQACRLGLRRTVEDYKAIGLSDLAISDQFALDILSRKRADLKAKLSQYPELIQAEKLRIQLNRYINHVRR